MTKPRAKPRTKPREPTAEERRRCVLNVEQLVLGAQALAEKSSPADVASEMLLASALFAMEHEIPLPRFMDLFGRAMTAALHHEVDVVVHVHPRPREDGREDAGAVH